MTRITTPIHLSQAVHSQRALRIRQLIDAFLDAQGKRPFNQGTPARRHKITDRAARKASARQLEVEGVLGGLVERFAKPDHRPHQRRALRATRNAEKVARLASGYGQGPQAFMEAYSYGNGAIVTDTKGDVYAIVAEKLLSSDRYVVEEREGGWWVTDPTADAPAILIRGPYAAKKTANRVARTLNGG